MGGAQRAACAVPGARGCVGGPAAATAAAAAAAAYPDRISAAGTPIVALPPASQLEPGVLDALPLSVRRELERAYGAHNLP